MTKLNIDMLTDERDAALAQAVVDAVVQFNAAARTAEDNLLEIEIDHDTNGYISHVSVNQRKLLAQYRK
jgi:hypothetical protein